MDDSLEPLGEAVVNLVGSVLVLLVTLTIIPFLCKLFIPVVGEMIWQGYWRLVGWSIRLPFRLIRFVVANVRGR